MSEATFPLHTLDSAPVAARRRMAGINGAFGYLPAGVGLMATSPPTLEGFASANAQFEGASLDPVSREVVVMTIAVLYECHVCVAMHTARLERLDAPAELIVALRERGQLDDERYEALRTFTLAAIDGRGVVDENVFQRFRDVGYDEQNALEVVLAIGVYTISAFANRMTGAPLDEPMSAYAWHGAVRRERGTSGSTNATLGAVR